MGKSVFQILLGFSNASILLLQPIKSISLPVLNGHFVEKPGVGFPLLEPFDVGFLAPIGFLLSLSLIEFLQESIFLNLKSLIITIKNNLGLEMLDLSL